MDKKTVGVGALVALIIALGVTYFTSPGKEIVNTVKETVREVVQEQVGAVPNVTNIDSGPICIEGSCEWPKAGTCADATTTIFAVQNPFRATSTVSFVRLSGKNGTTSIDLFVGTSTNISLLQGKGTSTTPVDITPSIIATALVSTSSRFFVHNNMNWDVNGGTVTSYSGYNNLFTPGFRRYLNDTSSLGNAATTSVQTGVVVGPDDYVLGWATSSFLYADAAGLNGNQGVTNATNGFSCDYSVKFEK